MTRLDEGETPQDRFHHDCAELFRFLRRRRELATLRQQNDVAIAALTRTLAGYADGREGRLVTVGESYDPHVLWFKETAAGVSITLHPAPCPWNAPIPADLYPAAEGPPAAAHAALGAEDLGLDEAAVTLTEAFGSFLPDDAVIEPKPGGSHGFPRVPVVTVRDDDIF